MSNISENTNNTSLLEENNNLSEGIQSSPNDADLPHSTETTTESCQEEESINEVNCKEDVVDIGLKDVCESEISGFKENCTVVSEVTVKTKNFLFVKEIEQGHWLLRWQIDKQKDGDFIALTYQGMHTISIIKIHSPLSN
ncbi:hypothetical protein GWI33_001733 [Rhynchophorus ferrugineus]|uniref:Uncharacterized protein n=1 Tax=Rhynchophorus ferrugineus TaxID=354439 RepID=A0A834IXW0_RHYFE|nr:hypothetical protein GWI33_001733 [Rhynchophorus ferrugineus]